MIVIDGKAHRNMPEQVAKNQKDIEDIFNTLDGLNIQDNVVAISDLSHLLTQDELVIAERAVAFIVYNDHLFIKRNQDATNAYFDIVFSISGSTVISFNSDEMQVNLTTGALTLVSNTFATYSKTELDTLLGAKASVSYVDTQLALKANLNGANFTGAITAPSIIEDMTGYNFTKGTSTASTTLEFIYAGAVKNGNKLTFVLACNVTKLSNGYNQTLGTFKMPLDVWNKLYPVNIGGYDYLYKGKVDCVQNSDLSIVQVDCEVKKYGTDAILIDFHNVALAVNDKSYFRLELTFLLSDNMVS